MYGNIWVIKELFTCKKNKIKLIEDDPINAESLWVEPLRAQIPYNERLSHSAS